MTKEIDPLECKHPKEELEFISPNLPKKCKLCGRYVRVRKK